MSGMIGRVPTWWQRVPVVVLMVVGAAALAAAHFSEHVLGYAPCPLCLDQREAVWAALIVGAAGLALQRMRPQWKLIAMLGALGVGLAYLYGAWIAGFHSGVEWGIFDPPPTCVGAGGALDLSDPDALLRELQQTSRIPNCADAPFRLAGLSMANMNFILMGALAVAGLWAAWRQWSQYQREARLV